MSEVFDDPRWRQSEEQAVEAEHASDRGDLAGARSLYRRAAEQAGAFALSIDGSMPRTRAIAAVTAVVLAARGGDFHQAVMLAEMFLASPGSLPVEGVAELETLRASYLHTLATSTSPKSNGPRTGNAMKAWRQGIRNQFHADAAHREAA